jgi:hypothetical protein
MGLQIPGQADKRSMGADGDVSVSNPIKKDDFGDLFEEHNHYLDNHGFQSNGSYHPADFSISSDSDSDIDCVMPQFEEPRFSDSDEEQEYEAGGDNSELDLLEDPLFALGD